MLKSSVIVCALVWALLGLCALPAISRAAGTSHARAKALFREGNSRYDRGDYAGALDRYRQARALYPSPKLDFNIGLSLQAQGQLAEAAEQFERVLRGTEAKESRIIQATRRRLSSLRQVLARVEVHCVVDAAVVEIDHAPVGQTPLDHAVYLRPGNYRVTVSPPGHEPYVRQATLASGDHLVVQVPLVVRTDQAPPEPRRVPVFRPPAVGQPLAVRAAEAAARPRRRVWTWVAAGVAGAALIGGIVLGSRVRSAQEEYDRTEDLAHFQDLAAQGRREALLANVMFGTAGALAASTIALYLLEGRPRGPRTRPRVTIGLAGAASSLSLNGRF